MYMHTFSLFVDFTSFFCLFAKFQMAYWKKKKEITKKNILVKVSVTTQKPLDINS